MTSYWYQGHNASFIYLRDRVDQMQSIREEPDDENNVGNTALEECSDFFQSFQRRGRRVWAQLSSPYEKEDPRKIDDFIADDDEEEEIEDTVPAPFAVFRDEKDPNQQIIDSLRKRRGRRGYVDESDYDNESSEEEELEIIDGDQDSRYYSEDEEEDDWTKKKKAAIKKRKQPEASASAGAGAAYDLSDDSDAAAAKTPSSERKTELLRGPESGRQKGTPNGNATTSSTAKASAASASSSAKKRRIIESSDDEEEE